MAAIFLSAPLIAPAAETPAVVTLVEGSGTTLLRGTMRHVLTEGVHLQPEDIIEVGDSALAQVEFADGVAISLGPKTRFYAAALPPRAPDGIPEFYVMRGWIKLKSTIPVRCTTPWFGLYMADTTAVIHADRDEGRLFVEAGELRITEGSTRAHRGSVIAVRGSQFYARRADRGGVILPQAPPGFLAMIPRPFMDNLPTRIATHKESRGTLTSGREVSYGEVEMWLKSPTEIRRLVMQRFVRKAEEPAFRQALIANLRFHPEWSPILFPESPSPEPRSGDLHSNRL